MVNAKLWMCKPSLKDNEKAKEVGMGKTLTSLISQTWKFIVMEADDEAMEGLSLLYSLFIKPIEMFVKYCQRLMLSIHEQLALVPFASLFDNQSERFCIQERTISYIPSICVLPPLAGGAIDGEGFAKNAFHCLQSGAHGLGKAIIAGCRHRGQAHSRNTGCIGPDITKDAVLAGLSKASMVLLFTHNIVDTYFPHGLLILQASNGPQVKETFSSSLTTLTS